MSGEALPASRGEDTEPVLEALLEGGAGLCLPVRGVSMLPTLLPGDRIVVSPCAGLPRPGQILLVRAAAGLVAHRLVSVEMHDGRRVYRTQGDAERGLDAGCRREAILGRVTAILRGGDVRPLDESPAALRRALFRLALRRRVPKLLRRAAALLFALASIAPARAQVFAPPATTYAPPPDYRFAPGDVLSLKIWDGEKLDEKQLTVQSDGTAFLPLPGLGSVTVGGRTAPEAKREIEAKLAKIYKEIYTELLVLRYAGHRVHLMGEVRTTSRTDSGPGDWALSGPTPIVSFLAEHGGPSPEADLMRVQLVRKGGETRDVNLFRAVFQHSEEDNPVLEDGDFVFLPSLAMGTRKVFVLGEVNAPGVVTIYDRMTLLEALARCGGLSVRGNPKEIVLIKRHPDGTPDLKALDLKELVKTGKFDQDYALDPGDVVYVSKGFLAHLHDVFSIISPALDTIESLYIINNFHKQN